MLLYLDCTFLSQRSGKTSGKNGTVVRPWIRLNLLDEDNEPFAIFASSDAISDGNFDSFPPPNSPVGVVLDAQPSFDGKGWRLSAIGIQVRKEV